MAHLSTWLEQLGASPRMFSDRKAAGVALAQALLHLAGQDAIVLGLPRGGVPVAAEVARVLGAALDVWVVRKIGAPLQPELGVGAVAEGPEIVLDREILELLGIDHDEVLVLARHEQAEVERRVARFRGGRATPTLEGRIVILVDDGIATGGTMRAAIRAIRKQHPRRLVLAVPVAAPDVLDSLRPEVDEIVCLHQVRDLRAVGLWYEDFRQVPDEVVVRLLEASRPIH